MPVRQVACPVPDSAFTDDGVLTYHRGTEALWLRGASGTTVAVSDSHISVEDREYDDHLFGIAAGLWLRRQGFLVLHANAVVKDGRAVLLMGASGAGKTTITRALLDRGCELVTDDLGVVDVREAVPMIMSGPGRLKTRLTDGADHKHVERISVVDQPARVAAALCLRPGGPVSVQQVRGPAASLSFVQHAHMPRSLQITVSEKSHFEGACRLATAVPVYTLYRGGTRADLPAAVDAVLGEVWP